MYGGVFPGEYGVHTIIIFCLCVCICLTAKYIIITCLTLSDYIFFHILKSIVYPFN